MNFTDSPVFDRLAKLQSAVKQNSLATSQLFLDSKPIVFGAWTVRKGATQRNVSNLRLYGKQAGQSEALLHDILQHPAEQS